MALKFLSLLILLTFLSTGCSDNSLDHRVKIAFNPWPGYEHLYLAQEIGLFKQAGLDIELVELTSLSDVLRVYEHGHVDGMASTVIETVLATDRTQDPLSIVLVTDYSNGGDAIIASTGITSVKDLKGKKIGTELGSLGIYVLARALQKQGLSLSDVETINTEQLEVVSALETQEVDAVVSYPPFSVDALKLPNTHKIFDSREIPGDIMDLVSIKQSKLDKLPNDWLQRFYEAWNQALEYTRDNPKTAYKIMANRQGVPISDFMGTLNDLILMDSEQSHEILKSRAEKNLRQVCEVMDYNNQLITNCNEIAKLLKPVGTRE